MKWATKIPIGQVAEPQIDELLRDIIVEERHMNDGRYAVRVHTHPEIRKLETSLADLISFMRPPDLSIYALKEHAHPISVTALKNVECGEELRGMLKAQWCPLKHDHPMLENRQQNIEEENAALRVELDKLQSSQSQDKRQISILADGLKKLTGFVDSVKSSIPVLPKEEPEIMAARFCLIPHRCAGRKIRDIKAVDLEGNPAEAKILFREKTVHEGDSFNAGDLLHLPPNCVVLFRFQ